MRAEPVAPADEEFAGAADADELELELLPQAATASAVMISATAPAARYFT
jgi:hypothetical protein